MSHEQAGSGRWSSDEIQDEHDHTQRRWAESTQPHQNTVILSIYTYYHPTKQYEIVSYGGLIWYMIWCDIYCFFLNLIYSCTITVTCLTWLISPLGIGVNSSGSTSTSCLKYCVNKQSENHAGLLKAAIYF